MPTGALNYAVLVGTQDSIPPRETNFQIALITSINSSLPFPLAGLLNLAGSIGSIVGNVTLAIGVRAPVGESHRGVPQSACVWPFAPRDFSRSVKTGPCRQLGELSAVCHQIRAMTMQVAADQEDHFSAVELA